jgi:hypothetical protein
MSLQMLSGIHNLLNLDLHRIRRILIHLQRIDLPVRSCKRRRVIRDVILAGGVDGRAAALAPDVAGPGAAEGCVEDLAIISA